MNPLTFVRVEIDVSTNGDGTAWQNILGVIGNLSFERGSDLDGVVDKPRVGTLTAVLEDPLLDPSSNPRVRPGRQIRVTCDQNSNGVYHNLWWGNLTTIDVNYKRGKPRVTLQAVDVWAKADRALVPEGWNGSLPQRVNKALTGTGITATMMPNWPGDAAIATPKLIDVQENATLTEQLIWISVAKNAYLLASPDAAARVEIYYAGELNYDPEVTFSDTKADVGAVYYHDIDVNFGSQALFNEFMVERHNLDEEDGQKTYGPYSNAASKAQWGTKADTIETNDGVPRTIAERYGRMYANPEIFPSIVKFDGAKFRNTFALNSVYNMARVKHAPSGLDKNYRMIAVSHDLSPDGWDAAVELRPVEADTAVTITNPPGGAASGPGDLVQPEPGILSTRQRSTTFSVANNAETTIPLIEILTEDGISYDSSNRWVIPKDGRYDVTASLGWAANATGNRVVQIVANGTIRARGRIVGTAGTSNIVSCARTLKLKAGDVVSVTGVQSSGGALVTSSAPMETFASVVYIGP